MLGLCPDRPHSQPISKRRTFSGELQQAQPDARTYRYLLFLMSQHVNAFAKAHRQILGEIDQKPKIKISKDEQFSMSQVMEKIYVKQGEKLWRDALARNQSLRKQYEQYVNIYKNSHPDFIYTIQKTQQEQPCSLDKPRKHSYSATPNRNSFYSTSPSRRPFSSKGPGGRQAYNKDFLVEAYNGFNQNMNNLYKMKTIEGHFSDNPEIAKKDKKAMTTHRGILKQDIIKAKRVFFKDRQLQNSKQFHQTLQDDNFLFNGSEIIICDNRQKNENRQLQMKQMPLMSQSAKFCNKRMINMKYAQKKSIDQIEKMQIQSRINMANSGLGVNVAQSQGYKPKSKCWQNYFN